MLSGLAVLDCCLVSFHSLWAILCLQAVQFRYNDSSTTNLTEHPTPILLSLHILSECRCNVKLSMHCSVVPAEVRRGVPPNSARAHCVMKKGERRREGRELGTDAALLASAMMQKIGMRPLTASCTHTDYGGGGGWLSTRRRPCGRTASGGACPKDRPTATCGSAARRR